MQPARFTRSSRMPAFLVLGLLVGATAACTSQRLVAVRDRCGRCRFVAAPIVPCRCGPIRPGPVASPAEPLAGAIAPAPAAAVPDPSNGSGTAAILGKLEKARVKGLAWEEIDLPRALTYLRTITGLEFRVSEQARVERLDNIVISLELDDVTVRALLDLLTEPYAMRWEVRDGAVELKTIDEIDGALRLR